MRSAGSLGTQDNEAESQLLRWEINDPLAVGKGGIIRFKCEGAAKASSGQPAGTTGWQPVARSDGVGDRGERSDAGRRVYLRHGAKMRGLPEPLNRREHLVDGDVADAAHGPTDSSCDRTVRTEVSATAESRTGCSCRSIPARSSRRSPPWEPGTRPRYAAVRYRWKPGGRSGESPLSTRPTPDPGPPCSARGGAPHFGRARRQDPVPADRKAEPPRRLNRTTSRRHSSSACSRGHNLAEAAAAPLLTRITRRPLRPRLVQIRSAPASSSGSVASSRRLDSASHPAVRASADTGRRRTRDAASSRRRRIEAVGEQQAAKVLGVPNAGAPLRQAIQPL